MFFGISSAAIAAMQNPPVTDRNDSCRDRGVSVNTSSTAVTISNNSTKPADYNMNVTTQSGNTYNYDSRNSTNSTSASSTSTYTQTPKVDGSSSYYSSDNIESVDIKCYDR